MPIGNNKKGEGARSSIVRVGYAILPSEIIPDRNAGGMGSYSTVDHESLAFPTFLFLGSLSDPGLFVRDPFWDHFPINSFKKASKRDPFKKRMARKRGNQ